MFEALTARFFRPGVMALVLVGSFARGDAGPFSDVDLLCVMEGDASQHPEAGSHLIDGCLVVVSCVTLEQLEAAFVRPEMAVQMIAGLRSARILMDPQGIFAAVQARARVFVWDTKMQTRANAYAAAEMVGWIEEVHKALAGLHNRDVGRLLNARFGLSWGLSRVMQVQRGVLLSGDNGFYAEVAAAVGDISNWNHLRRTAFGIEGQDGLAPDLCTQVRAGLQLYMETAVLLSDILPPDSAALVDATVTLIRTNLASL
ncbi:MAG: Nucleotidyltransferase domain protein [Chloroflexi bacterium ADurb.Bin360]|nr:MAG: Nucleotidyltransferase domain protein [Chloroflexi bacterium ADurb.Bin360]